MVWGVFPIFEGMSWESHLFGAITGLILSFAFAKSTFIESNDEVGN
jgi:membrane associated rhomboid family serine protease